MSGSVIDTLNQHAAKDGFRLRGLGASRLDAFSDVVFGFALTLLVVSLEVPKTFAELHASLRGFLPFAICFFFLLMVWHAHYQYFRRFGTHDMRTIVINGVLLFVVLFYVYPLKFLFTVVSNGLLGVSNDSLQSNAQVRELMLLYAVGFTAIYLLFMALYLNAWRQRSELELSPLEKLLTQEYIGAMAVTALVGVVAAVLAVTVPAQYAGLTGWTYATIGVVQGIWGRIVRKRVKALGAVEAKVRNDATVP